VRDIKIGPNDAAFFATIAAFCFLVISAEPAGRLGASGNAWCGQRPCRL